MPKQLTTQPPDAPDWFAGFAQHAPAPAADSGTVTGVVSVGGTIYQMSGTLTGAAPIPTPTPVPTPVPPPIPTPVPPTGVINVVTMGGAKGDGQFDNTALLQKLADANVGKTLYFPAGVYLTADAIHCDRGNVGFLGDGSDKSILSHQGKRGIDLGIRADQAPQPGYSVRKLGFRGLPGQYMKTGNSDPSIQLAAARGAVIEDCNFVGSGEPINVIGQSTGTQINRCHALGWGTNAVFCNGGEQVHDCLFTQDDSDLYGERSSHGFYIHGGAKSITVENVTVENARKFAGQLYSETPNSTIEDIVFRNCLFRGCQEGWTVQQGGAGKGRAKRVLFEGCQFFDTYRYTGGFWLKHGEDITIRACTFTRSRGPAIALGRYNGWDNPSWAILERLVVEDCTFVSCPIPVYAENVGNNGKFVDCVIRRSTLVNSPAIQVNQPGITVQP